jgi:lipopolysaccharide biosynthesis regulator YciM
MKRRFSLLRPITRLAKSVSREVHVISQGISSAADSLTTIREESVIVGGFATRKKPTWTNFVNPVFWVLQAIGFVGRYFRSRNPIAGLQGFPAVIGVAAPVLAVLLLAPSARERTTYARGRMDFHEERQELDRADFYARQLCFLAPKNPRVLLSRAQLLDKMERSGEARAVALQLANEYEFLPAVEWLSEKELFTITNGQIVDSERDRQLESWLTWIIDQQPDHLRANFMLGTLRMMRGEYVNAIPPLKTVTRVSRVPIPEASYSLAVSLKATGQIAASQSNAAVAADAFLERDSRQSFDLKKTAQTLRALVMASREQEAAELIQQVTPQRSEEEKVQLQSLLGEVYAQLSKRLRTRERRTPQDLAIAVDAIYRAVAVAQSNPIVMEELTQLSCSAEINDTSLRQQLDIALNSGVSPGLIHFILGTRMLTATPPDPDGALKHFELAAAHNAAFPGLLNNMADAMVESEDEDLDLAFRMVNQAIDFMPNQAYFFDTRGKILRRQGKTLEAIADFEKALAAPEIRGIVHESLAAAWKSLGDDAESERHTRLADWHRQREAEASPTDAIDETQLPESSEQNSETP